MTNLEKILEEFEDKLFNDWVNQIDYDDIQSAKSFITKVYNQAHEAGRQEAIEEVRGKQCY